MTGTHILLDVYGVDAKLLKDLSFIKKILKKSAKKASATILHNYFHKFGGAGGVTGIVALVESHISIHTWPEDGYAAIDIFMCGLAEPEKAVKYLEKKFVPKSCSVQIVNRGRSVTDL